jgi:hypothetical protein
MKAKAFVFPVPTVHGNHEKRHRRGGRVINFPMKNGKKVNLTDGKSKYLIKRYFNK